MDGTLVDSMWVWEEIDQDFFRSRGMEFPENLHKEIEGMSFTETAEYFVRTYQMAGNRGRSEGNLEQDGCGKVSDKDSPEARCDVFSGIFKA